MTILNSRILENPLKFNYLLFFKVSSLWIIGVILLFYSNHNPLAAEESKTLRIGYQPYGTLVLVKGRGQLGNKLSNLNVVVEWIEFKSGIEMLGAFGDRTLDFIVAGEVPPVFMQSADIPLVYVGYEPPSPKSVAIVVAKDSTISTITDLRGKKIAFAKGTNVHFLFFKVLEKAGLTEQDLQIVYLPPDQGRKAFENGTIDAWAIWDPFLAAVQQELDAKVLIDGQGLVPGYQFYLARRAYLEQNPLIIEIIFDEIRRIDVGIRQNPSIVAKFMAPRIGLSPLALETAIDRMNTGVRSMDDESIIAQQNLADLFHQKGLIRKIFLKEALAR
jgi:sulfonate transport system substrate-binding protein